MDAPFPFPTTLTDPFAGHPSRETVQFFCQGMSYRIHQRRKLREGLQAVAREESSCIGHLNIVLCDTPFLRTLNQSYLSHDTDTDVITFDLREPASTSIEGEIYIGLDQVRLQAKQEGVAVQEELCRMMIHGVLHLCGYTDDTAAGRSRMRAKEAHYLSSLFCFGAALHTKPHTP